MTRMIHEEMYTQTAAELSCMNEALGGFKYLPRGFGEGGDFQLDA